MEQSDPNIGLKAKPLETYLQGLCRVRHEAWPDGLDAGVLQLLILLAHHDQATYMEAYERKNKPPGDEASLRAGAERSPGANAIGVLKSV